MIVGQSRTALWFMISCPHLASPPREVKGTPVSRAPWSDLETGAAFMKRKRPTNYMVGQSTVTKRREYKRELVGCLVLPELSEPIRRKGSVSSR